jgi:hypothetical protein
LRLKLKLNKKERDVEASEPETEEAEAEEEDGGQPESRVVQEMRAQVAELERSRQQADQDKLKAFERKKREAVAAGDTESYDQLRREEAEFYQTLASRGPQQAQQSDAAITNRWMQKNRWMANHFLAGHAQAIAQRYADKGITGEAQLRKVEAEMRAQFSDMISNYESGRQSKPGSPSVTHAGRSKRDWNSVPASERKLLTDQYFRPGAAQRLPDTPASRARMAKAWWDSNHPEE